ncbi:MAG: type II secretion system GspH family protein [Thiovulaceae bacterium]|nr:type II secretion system GspH family protein [Sulfurimonadaceae bacterium]MCW9027235.1 type II secretion system GspH family protein [Sulfurimonadaceae bacterium]
MKNFKKAFTMVELVFVIVVLGILAAIAVPRLTATREDAEITKGRADIASIRSAIMSERQSQIIKGISTFIPKLTANTTDSVLFKGDGTRTLLTYGIKKGDWQHTAAKTYTYTVGTTTTTFTYNDSNGIFTCTADADFCNKLTD